MLGINCLINNIQIRPQLQQIVEYTGYNLAANGKRPTIQNVFNTLRQANLEVDIQTVSHLYENAFDLTDGTFSNQQEVEDARSDSFRRIANKRRQLVKKNEIGKDSPVTSAASQLANMLTQDLKGKPTVQKLMQDRLVKAAKRIMQIKGKAIQSTKTEDILREVLSIENKNPYYVFGAMENAQTLFTELQKEFSDLSQVAGSEYQKAQIQDYASILEQSAYGFLLSAPETRQIITDTLKEAKYTKEINTNNGVKTVVDWNRVATSNIDFRETIKDVFTTKGFSANEVSRIADELEGEFQTLQQTKAINQLNLANKMAAKVKTPQGRAAIDKLLSLYNLGAFSNAQQDALMKVLGVSNLGQQQVNALRGLMMQYNKSTQLPMAKWSPTYIKTLQREIENHIEEIEEQDGKLKALRVWGFFTQMNGAAILANLQNIYENTSSGLVEYLATMVRNPSQAAESVKIFANVFTDIIGGGVREGTELSNAFNTSGNIEERFNWETAKTGKQKFVAGLTTMSRALLSSFDNGYKASITHLLTINTMKKVLMKQGLSSDESSILINESYFGNRAEVEDVAKQLEQNLKAAGVKNVSGKWKRMAAEISMANLLSDGQFFKNTFDRLQQQGAIGAGKSVNLNEDFIKMIRRSAESAAGKGLGHEADSQMLKLMDKINSGLNENITSARKDKDKKALVRAELGRNVYGMVNRFRSGALRWTWLSFQKASGLALIQTLITDVAINKGKYLNIDNLNLNNPNHNETSEELSRYLALRQRLVRESVVPIVSYTIGYGVILPALLKAFGGDDDDKKAYGKLAKWIQEDPARNRWFQKALPVPIYNYLDKQTKDNYGQISIRKDAKAPSLLDVVDPEIAANAIVNNLNQSALFKVGDDVKKELNREKGNYGVPIGKFLGNTLNLGGFLKNYQINSDAIKVFSEPTKLSKTEYNKLKPKDFLDGFLYNSLNRGLYKEVRNK